MPKKVLVIDDDHGMLDLMKFTLQQGGYDISTCDSGRKAWGAIIDEEPSLIVLDVMLPGIDGYSLQVKISNDEKTNKIPVVVLTARGSA